MGKARMNFQRGPLAGRIAGALWDLHEADTTVETYYKVNASFGDIWSVVLGRKPATMASWWQGWLDAGLDGCSALGTLFQNTKYKFQFMVPPASAVTSQSDTEARIDLPFTQGTLLTSKYINLTVVEGVSPCKNTVASGAPPTSSENVTINGVVFLKETGSEPAAGNLFEWEAYSVVRPNTNGCARIGIVLPSSNPGSSSPPPPPFDKAAESAVFQTILSTLAWIP